MDWANFFAMGGRGAFVWGSFGVTFVAIALEIFLLRLRKRKAQLMLRDEQ